MKKGVAVLEEGRFGRRVRLLLVGVPLDAAGGCLSLGLGEKTTYVHHTPESEARLCGLETRVAALEQAMTTRAAASLPYEPVEAIPGQPASARSSFEAINQGRVESLEK